MAQANVSLVWPSLSWDELAQMVVDIDAAESEEGEGITLENVRAEHVVQYWAQGKLPAEPSVVESELI